MENNFLGEIKEFGIRAGKWMHDLLGEGGFKLFIWYSIILTCGIIFNLAVIIGRIGADILNVFNKFSTIGILGLIIFKTGLKIKDKFID